MQQIIIMIETLNLELNKKDPQLDFIFKQTQKKWFKYYTKNKKKALYPIVQYQKTKRGVKYNIADILSKHEGKFIYFNRKQINREESIQSLSLLSEGKEEEQQQQKIN
ncbi:hypothetical protein ABPG74_020049 [Tetrahymena malaccensis]